MGVSEANEALRVPRAKRTCLATTLRVGLPRTLRVLAMTTTPMALVYYLCFWGRVGDLGCYPMKQEHRRGRVEALDHTQTQGAEIVVEG